MDSTTLCIWIVILSHCVPVKVRSRSVRIAEVSQESGLPVATVKFYLREGLVPPGAPTAANQAEYDDRHLRRLRLIRVLVEVGGLSLRQVGAVLAAIDEPDLPPHEMLGMAHHALGPFVDEDPSADSAQASTEVDRFVDDDLGWRVSASAPGRRALAQALVTLRRWGRDADVSLFRPYARAADWLASEEVETVARRATDRADHVQQVVVGTVVYEAAFVALRRLAQEHRSALASRTPRLR
jgi:DNA-binding transcriptional MerR regulator